MDIKDIAARYLLMLLAAVLSNLSYILLAPLTIYPVYWLLSIFYSASLSGAVINVHGKEIEIINACIAGSAYFLLLVLNLSTPKIKLKKRLLVLLIDFGALLILNIFRIFLLSVLLVNETVFFETVHIIFWYSLSIALVFLIWVLTAKIFEIKKIPFYSDVKEILRTIRLSRKARK